MNNLSNQATNTQAFNKIEAIAGYWRTHIGTYFIEHASQFVNQLPNLLFEEAKLLTGKNQQDYLDIVSLLRQNQSHIKAGMDTATTAAIENFISYVKRNPRSDTDGDLSLIDTEDIEFTVVTESLASRVASPINDTLNDAFLRIRQLVPSIREAHQLPCHPKSLIQAMLDGFATLPLSTSQKVILAKLFAPTLDTKKLASIVAQSLVDSDIDPFDKTIRNIDHSSNKPTKRRNVKEDLEALVKSLSQVDLKAVSDAHITASKAAASKYNADDQNTGKAALGVGAAAHEPNRKRPNTGARTTQDADKLLEQLGELKQLRQQLAQMPVTPKPKNPMVSEQQLKTNELNTLLGELQTHQPTATVKENTDIQSIEQVRNQIRAKLKSDNEIVQTLQEKDTDIINLMSLMFDYILDNPNLPLAMKALLARLQIPMLRVALKSPEFFSQSEHSARKVLDTLAKAGIGWDSASQKDSYYNKLEHVVFRIIREFRDDLTIFDTLYNELTEYLSAQSKHTERTEARTRSKENKKAQTISAQQFVAQQIQERIAGKQLHTSVVKILQNGWRQVLYQSYIRHGKDSNQYASAVKVMDALIWSVCVPSQDEVKEWLEQVAHVHQKLIANLSKGLSQVNFDALEKNQLIDDINTLHNTLVKSGCAPKQDDMVNIPPSSDDTSLKSSDSVPNSEHAQGSEQDQGSEVSMKYMYQVTKLTTGTWVEFDVLTDSPKRRKLVAIIQALDKMIFTNRRGIKVAEIKLISLAQMLEKGEVKIIQNENIIDKAISSVVKIASTSEA